MEEERLDELQAEIDAKLKEQKEKEEKASIDEKQEGNQETSNAVAINDMTYTEVTEMAKKSNLVATANDKNFVAELSDKNKDILKASIDIEKERLDNEKQQMLLEREKLATEKEKNLNERLKERFGSKLDAQEYHYKSLQPILETFGIKKPMNVWVMWTIAIIGCLTLIYPIKLLFCATFGNLIAGASSESRKGFAKGCMWTAVAILGLAIITLVIFGIVKLGQKLF